MNKAATQGADPSAWRASANPERIKFVPGLLPLTIRYTNRPTGIQQVLSFSGAAPGTGGAELVPYFTTRPCPERSSHA